MRQALVGGAFGALSVLAVAGWMRTPTPSVSVPQPLEVQTVADTQTLPGATSAFYVQPGTAPAYVPAAQPMAQRMQAAPERVYAPAPRRAARMDDREGRTVRRDAPYRDAGYSSNDRTRRDERYRDAEPVYREGRSKGRSAAIVAGSAGAGAAIGAMAGGGKGAAIGAVSGGAAGLIYDRMTHKTRSGW